MTIRREHRRQTMEAILSIGRRQLATVGARDLSLRAIARELGVVSSAVYRYVPSRDDLLTELVIDAYERLGDHVDAAHDAVPADDFAARLTAVATALRSWALQEPSGYALIYGSPVTGYAAPAERTNQPAMRVVTVLLRIFEDAEQRGPLVPGAIASPAHEDMERLRAALGVEISDRQAQLALLAWSCLLGWVSSEAFGHLTGLAEPGVVFALHVESLAHLVGLSREQNVVTA